MSFQIFIVDNNSSIELDTTDVDIGTTFSISDISDLSARKDNITKQINFKGTKNNNYAFGSMFHLNKVSDVENLPNNKLFFNYNPLVTVDCVVYEEGMLLLRGNLRVLEVNVVKGIINYGTVITGKFIEFKNIIQDQFLYDSNDSWENGIDVSANKDNKGLCFTDLKHRYSVENIKKSWDTSIEIYQNSTFSDISFEKGKGYVYPFIEYGQQFLIEDSNQTNYNTTIFHGLNFRPAIYAKEYLNKIFSQEKLSGWTYEIKTNDATFLEKFNSLIIPNSEEKLVHKFSKGNMHFQQPTVVTDTQSSQQKVGNPNSGNIANLLTISDYQNPPLDSIAPFISNQTDRILFIDRSFKSDAKVVVNFDTIHNPNAWSFNIKVQLVKRVASLNNTEQFLEWENIIEKEFVVGKNVSISTKTIELDASDIQFERNTNLAVRVLYACPTIYYGTPITYNVGFVSVDIPKNANTPFYADVKFSDDGINYDVITPTATENIKQIDFIKSIMSLFNLYAYTEKQNPKHLIFQKYDEYYQYANPALIRSNSTDWTNKIDGSNYKIKSNLTIPKNYQFLYKEDSDFINSDYKSKYGKIFGTHEHTDRLGVVDSIKIELIFSPTPIVEFAGTTRKLPALFGGDLLDKKNIKTNIRILYYNGLQKCTSYSVRKDSYNFSSRTWTTSEIISPSERYPQASTYYIDSTGKPIEDLNFDRPKEYYFPATDDYINAASAYSTYYINQITELKNVNIFTVEADVWLNEIDITNLDLRTPIFIDLGSGGHGYFKIISLTYYDNKSISKALLQKIYLGTKT